MALLTTGILVTLSMALLATAGGTQRGVERTKRNLASFYGAEAGIDEAVAILAKSGKTGLQAVDYPRRQGGVSYRVSAVYGDESPTLADDRIRLLATGDDGGVRSSIEMVVRSVPTSFFTHAVFGYDYATMASNSQVDSYDSDLGTYASQVSGGHARSNGSVGSNGNITLAANSGIYGNAEPGPSGTVSAAGNTTITGTTTPASSLVPFPAITVPSIASSGAYTVSGSRTLGPGDLHYSTFSFNSNSSLHLVGPVTFVVDSFDQRSNTTFTIDATNGPVRIYGTGSFRLRSNASMSSTAAHAQDVGIYLTGNNISGGDAIEFNSNSTYVGTIYAPNALTDISSNFGLYGAVMARRFNLSSNSRVHFDEALLRDESNGPPTLAKVAWRRLTEEQASALGAP